MLGLDMLLNDGPHQSPHQQAENKIDGPIHDFTCTFSEQLRLLRRYLP